MANDPKIQLQYIIEAALAPEPDIVVAPALFHGTLKVDDSDPERPWAYLSVEKGIPESAYEALQLLGVPCEPRFSNPHMTVIKNDEALALKEKYGNKWEEAVLTGPEEFLYQIIEMVEVDPVGWDEMDRVWFLRCEAPALVDKRLSLGLTPLPTSEEGDPQHFHITCAVRPAVSSEESKTEADQQREAVIETLLR